MKSALRRSALAAALALSPLINFAADPEAPAPTPAAAAAPAASEPEPKTFVEALQRAGVKMVAGPAKITLGKIAEYSLPAGQHFVGPDSLDRYYELTQNMRSGTELGVVLSSADWVLIFKFSDTGYVKDDEKDKLDAAKLLAAMQEGQAEGNKARKERGWDELKIEGWASPPHYDEKTHNLTWAMNLSSSKDNHQAIWINQSIRLLGRGGIMNVTMVAEPASFAASAREVDGLLTGNFSYVQGQRYAEWKQGDKIAAYGLSALVLGGGAAAAAKMGLFSKFGALLAKLGKGIIVIIAGIGAAIAKLFRKLTGSHPTEEK
jgi:uncharacterized membrane-anchored protein